MAQSPPPPPQAPFEPEHEPTEPMMGEQEELNLIQPSLVEFLSLNEVKVFLFTEMQDQKQILSCLMGLYKCSIDIRPPQDPTVAQHEMILVPNLRRNSCFVALVMENGNPST